MLMTEQEARAKWCPHSRIVDGESENAGGCNRWVRKKEECRCIASDCMAWRFVDAEPTYERRSVTDDRFAARYKEACALPDDQAEAALDALDAERKAFAESWQPEAPEPGMELHRVSFNDTAVIASFRRIVHDRRGYCGAFGRPEV